ncbi:MAG: hypothetical protein K0R65_1225 [Crocinitomicaceae bacterium]|jgi:hypothetical protein|nr:hypothetical protein [Crocinitomicaceae bacterium]
MKIFFSRIRKNWLISLVLLISLFFMGKQSNEHFKAVYGFPRKHAVFSDGSGYYAYLPATFIHKDARFQFLRKTIVKHDTYDFISGININAGPKDVVNKYYVGTSILIAPFFGVNYAWQSWVNGDPGDGYERTYLGTVSYAAIFYYILGMLALILLLKSYRISNFTISFLIVGLTFGTSLNYYTVHCPSFSHVYSFFAINWFLYTARRFALYRKTSSLYVLFMLAALIFLLRPTNILVVLLFPFLFSDWKSFTACLGDIFRSKKLHLLGGVLLFGLIVFPQLLNIYLQTGKWGFNTYTNESFEFLTNPKIPEVLFSYRRGLFVYAPFLLLMIPGFWFFFRKNPRLFLGWVFVLGLNLYIIASWWCWWYGGGLGMRPLVEFSLLLALPIAFLLEASLRIVQPLYLVFLYLGCWVYQTYQFQFNANILHFDNVDKEFFWQIFMKTEPRHAWSFFFQDHQLPQGKITSQKTLYYYPENKSWGTEKSSDKYDFGRDPKIDFDIYCTFQTDKTKRDKIGLRVGGEAWITTDNSNPGFFVLFFRGGNVVRRKEFFIGGRIPELYTPAPFEVTVNPWLRTDDIDSLVVVYNRNIRPSAFRKLNVTYLNFSGN